MPLPAAARKMYFQKPHLRKAYLMKTAAPVAVTPKS
jgi:hypothetical protein